MTAIQPCGVHFVGSINLQTTRDVFNQVSRRLGTHVRRMPDGETGYRHHFIRWQADVFAEIPQILAEYDGTVYGGILPSDLKPAAPQDKSTVEECLRRLQTRYDDHALESYAIFKEMKGQGHIPKHVRFQVSLPGVLNVMTRVAKPYQVTVEPFYEDALRRSLERIQASIPHAELAIQIDVAIEIAFLEGAGPWAPYFDPIFPGVIERLSRFANNVSEDVELGFHLCYGDAGHRHFVEPRDLGLVVEIANALQKEVQRKIQWIHMPVPKGRKDSKYFAPLKQLDWEVPELYLGLVHPYDEEGTRERIVAAQQSAPVFGVATECGMGRTPPLEFDTIMDTLKAVSQPVV